MTAFAFSVEVEYFYWLQKCCSRQSNADFLRE
jgi:hypothetical protein